MLCGLLVPLVAMTVALGAPVTVLIPVILLGVLALFFAGRALGAAHGHAHGREL
ncbi:MAG TPA: hypothetical protein VH418_02410 [Solirubrobacteraceae bacterium]